jgi:hypothetical protein
MEQSGKHLEQSIVLLDQFINEELSRKDSKCLQRVFHLKFIQVKSYLQNAAIKSQLAFHEPALDSALAAKDILKDIALLMWEFSTKSAKVESVKKFYDNNSSKILEKFLLEITEKDPTLDRVSTVIGKNTEPIGGISSSKGQKTQGIIFWKHNAKNNEKYLKQELSKRYGDDFKGKKLDVAWLNEFNIGNIMHLVPVGYHEISHENCSVEQILKDEKLIELVLIFSCCLFSIATENRFLCHKESEVERKSTEMTGPVNNITKTYQLMQNENYRKSYVGA